MEKKSNHIVIDPADIALIVREIGREARHVIPILQAIQRKYNYLPVDALRQVCELTDITPAAISGVSTFYSQFRFQPAGRHRIKLCVGTACHVMGADTIYDAFKQELDIPEHEDTDKDHLFTIEKVACLGCCMLAPAVQIDHITYGHLTSNRVSNILADFLSSQNGLGNHDKAISPFRKSETSGVVRMCRCASCDASGAHKVYAEIRRQIDQHHLAVTLKMWVVAASPIRRRCSRSQPITAATSIRTSNPGTDSRHSAETLPSQIALGKRPGCSL